MPLPTRHPGESEQEFIGRCMPFVTEENNRKRPEERRTHEQLIAMCLTAAGSKKQQRHVTLHSHLSTRILGNALVIEGVLLRPGLYTGLDGVPTKYTEKFIHGLDEEIVGQPIKFAHEISPTSMSPAIPQGEKVGFWTNLKKNGVVRVRGYVFDKRAIEYARRHPKLGLSMEADVVGEEEADGIETATAGKLTGGVLIDDPACSECRIETAREVNLQSEERENPRMSATQSAEEFLAYTNDNLAGPTRDAFFKWFEDELKRSGVTDDVLGKVMAVVRKGIKSPYPYPSPKVASVMESQYGKELSSVMMKDLSEFSDFVGQCMKGGKSMVECTAEFKKSKAAPPVEEKLAMRLAEAEASLKTLTDAKAAEEAKELENLTKEIKTLEKDFEPTKFLEGVTCKVMQKKMLGKYLEVLKKNVKPIRLQVSQDQAKDQVATQVKEMFGEGASFESIFEVAEKK